MLKAYKYRIYPNSEQRIQIAKTFGCCRFVYNQTLAYRKEIYEKEKKSVSKTDCNNYCNRELKKDYEWLKEIDKFALTNAIYNMDVAYQKFFKEHAGYPKFKSKHDNYKSYTTNFTNGNIAVDFETGKIKLPKLKAVKARLHREYSGQIKSATVSQVSSGKYYVSILVETEHKELAYTNHNIGIDLGIKDLCITSDGKVYENLKIIKKYEKQLVKLQRQLSHKGKRSKNYYKTKKKPKLEKEIVLSPDSATVVEHGMFTKKVQITARRTDGRVYKVKFKPINFAQVKILNQDTVRLKLTIIPGPAPTEDFLYKAVEHSARFLMMVRRFNIQFTNSAGMMLPGFRPEIGDIFGQGRSSFGLSPGIGFAFGDVRRSYIDEAYEKGWLITDTERDVNAAVMTSTKNLNIRANLEPITGLKIDLTALRNDTRNTEIQFMYEGMPEIMGGNFTMTTIALGSAFGGSGNAMNNYSSKAFDKLLANREIIAQRIESKYSGLKYPDVGFIHDKGLGGMPYNPGTDNVNGVNRNSADVLIPAFLAAYTGKDPKKVGLTAFPSLKSMLPNWRVTYDGLIKIPAVKKYFKSLTLSHQYRCSYSVGAFTSFLNWVDAGQDGLGYIQSILNDNPTPSSPYSISSVSLTEAFSPLLGADATLLNNVTVRADYSTTRNLSLNTTSYQLVEALSKKVTIGLGYKYAEFNKVLKMKKTRDFSNDLTVRLDFSFNKMQSLIRKIDTQLTQATSGNIAKTISFSADYGLSRALTVRAFYDIQINEPLISSASYPTSNSNYGISLRFSLAQ